MDKAFLTVALSAAILTCVAPAQAQVAESDQTRLRRQGFSASDFQAFKITEISPSYRFFTEWNRCARNVASASVQSGKAGADSLAIASAMCGSAEREAVAVMAKSTGLAKAKRVMALAKAILKLRIEDQSARQNPSPPIGMTRVGRWQMHRDKGGACRIALPNGGFSVMLEVRPSEPRWELTFIQVGKQKSMFTDNPVFEPRETVILWNELTSRRLGVIEFVVRSPGQDITLRSFSPTEEQLILMSEATSIQFLRSDISLNISFPIHGLREARAAAEGCGAGR